MREVVLKMTTQKDLIKHQSAARTFGELKKEMRQVKWTGMRVVERASKATLQMDDAVLPQGDFLLFLVPEKVKSGRKTSGGTEELSKPIEECSYNECRSHMSWLNRNKDANLNMSGSTSNLQKQLKKYYKKEGGQTSATKQVAPKAEPKKPSKKNVEKVKKAKKKGLFAKKEKEVVPTDPIEIIEASRDRINKAVDQIVLNMIENGGNGTVPAILQYTEKDLEREIKKVQSALRTGRSRASYID